MTRLKSTRNKFITPLATLFVSILWHLMCSGMGWTQDNGIEWAVLNGLLIWLAFYLLGGIAERTHLSPIPEIIILALGAWIFWVVTLVTSTPIIVSDWATWGMAIPHFIMGEIAANTD